MSEPVCNEPPDGRYLESILNNIKIYGYSHLSSIFIAAYFISKFENSKIGPSAGSGNGLDISGIDVEAWNKATKDMIEYYEKHKKRMSLEYLSNML